ncbi:MAG: molybdenum cofactor guanylyltransferase [Ignavibacteriales bacterium]|nr:molybdenum cofactor guanylyltransferase [Ignavibacteriales bacterium]
MVPLGAVLAGGQSTRMGTDKALIPINGKPMIAWVVDTLKSVFDNVIVVADDGSKYELPAIRVIPDVVKKSGPLGGIHAALIVAAPAPVFVMPCDMPFFPADLIREFLRKDSHKPVRILWDGTRMYPLCGLYSQAALPVIAGCLKEGRLRMTDLVTKVGADLVNPLDDPRFNPRMLVNLNSPQDFEDPDLMKAL